MSGVEVPGLLCKNCGQPIHVDNSVKWEPGPNQYRHDNGDWFCVDGSPGNRPLAEPVGSTLFTPGDVIGHTITVHYTTNDDGIHLDCTCGWSRELGLGPRIGVLALAGIEHLSAVASGATVE